MKRNIKKLNNNSSGSMTKDPNNFQNSFKKFNGLKSNKMIIIMVLRILIVGIVFFLLSSFIDLYEQIDEFVNRYEAYELDEIIITGVFLGFWLVIEVLILLKRVKRKAILYEEYSFKDYLTNINNRRSFFRIADDKYKTLSDNHEGLTVYYLDLVKFKSINDNYGHKVGDALLKFIANYLKCNLNEEDTFARIGGDEFAIIHKQLSKGSIDYSTLLKKGVEVNLNSNEEVIKVFFSCGHAVYPDDGNTIEELLNCADKRMYVMKKNQK